MPLNIESKNENEKNNKNEKDEKQDTERNSIDFSQKESATSRGKIKSSNEDIKLNLDNNKGDNHINSGLRKKTNSKINKINDIKLDNNIKDDIFCEVNDTENKDDYKSTEMYVFKSKKFPQFSTKTFENKGAKIVKKVNNGSNSNEKEDSDLNKDKEAITHHKKTSTSETNYKESITNANSSNVSSTVEIVNTNNPTISPKEEDNNANFTNSEIDKKYDQLLLLAKRGDRQIFLDLFDQILSLPKNLLNLNYQDEKGNTALHYACDEGNLKIVEILLNSNCDPNMTNNKKETPLHLASKRGYFDISKKLIKKGALLNIYDLENNSPIHYACMNNCLELMIYFLTKNPKVDTENINGKKPIDLANDKEIKELLENYLKNKENNNKQIKNENINSKKKLEKSKKVEDNDTNKNIFTINDFNKYSVSPVIKSSRRKTITKKNGFSTITESPRLNVNIRSSLPDTNILLNNNFEANNAEKQYNTNTHRIKNRLKNFEKENLFNDNDKNKGATNLTINPSKNDFNQEKTLKGSSSNKNIKKNNLDKIFSPTEKERNKNRLNTTNLYNSVNKVNASLDESKINDVNNNKSLNYGHQRLSLSNKKPNGNSKAQGASRTINKDNNIPKAKSKFYANNTKNLFLDSIDTNNNNNPSLTQPDEKNKNKEKIVKNILKKNNPNKLETTEKLIPKFQEKGNKKNVNKYVKVKNTDNSLINNCNLTKISSGQNKKKMLLDSLNYSKINNKTLDDNIPSKFDLSPIPKEKINQSNFVCLAQLGKGSFGEVYLVQKIDTKEEYAMKVLRKDKIIGQNLLKYAIAERNVLSLSLSKW